MRHQNKLSAGLGVVTAGLLATGVAYAAWSSTGAGAGTARATTSVNSTIDGASHLADLYPGAAKTVTVTVSNPNDYPVIVTSISAGSSDAAGASGACAAATVTSDAVDDPAGIDQVGPATATIAGRGTGTFQLVTRMKGSATDACKGATFNLPLTAALQSNAVDSNA